MNLEERQRAEQMLNRFLDQDLERILLSNPVKPDQLSRIRLRPVLLKGSLRFQAEEQAGKQAFHRNLKPQEAAEYILDNLEGHFRQAEICSARGWAQVLVSKKGKITMKVKESRQGQAPVRIMPLSHNRQKRYILPEGTPVPFLVDLGVMTREGKIVHSRYDKFRQINRFLEMIEDVLPALNPERENTIIDFGCGKSYLTFAMYYYLKEVKGYSVRIIGLDLKEDVIRRCSQLAQDYGYQGLTFLCGDIADYEGVDQVDMVVTLHACDKATDYALAKAVGWGARVILSVPCCQHQLNQQMDCPMLEPVLTYGLIRERSAALFTDAIRAQVLEHMGYGVQILEFIEMEHTPKNLLIRAVRHKKPGGGTEQLKQLLDFLGVQPEIVRLLLPNLLEADPIQSPPVE